MWAPVTGEINRRNTVCNCTSSKAQLVLASADYWQDLIVSNLWTWHARIVKVTLSADETFHFANLHLFALCYNRDDSVQTCILCQSI